MATPHALEWILEPLESLSGLRRRMMFGCEAAYVDDRLVVVLADGREPWNGLLLPVERELQAEVRELWPALAPHPILGKWLYLSRSDPSFEEVALAAAERIRKGDPRLGTIPKPRRRRSKGDEIIRRNAPIPIEDARNLGPASGAWLRETGIRTLQQLEKLGWEKALAKVARGRPETLNLNFASALIGAINPKEKDRGDESGST